MKFFSTNKNHEEVTDNQLIISYKNSHDLEILANLYGRYMHLVYGVCLKYFKDDEQSKDAVMQIFEQLIDKLKIHEVQNFKSWLHVLTRNYCLMSLRKSGKHQLVQADDTVMENLPFPHHENVQDKEKEFVIMEKCIDTLPDEQKQSINLFYLQQKCYKEVVDLTGYDLGKVKSYIQNGKRNLKICMEKHREY